jgi:TPP-dependent pyruvate/acetoin dehydrogenase alpha subunit
MRMAKANGTAVVDVTAKNLKVPVNDDVLRRVYALMLKCRLMEERHGKDAAHSEAALAGAVVELTTNDAILATTPGTFVESMAAAAMIPTSGSGSSQLAIAAGVALAAKLRKKEDVVVAFTDATTLAFGTSYEAIAFAAAHKLPLVVFVRREDAAASGGTLRRAEAHGIAGLMVDVNDAVAIYRVGKEAIHYARAGRGPSLIECCASDIDPVAHMERYLKKQGSWSEGLRRELGV